MVIGKVDGGHEGSGEEIRFVDFLRSKRVGKLRSSKRMTTFGLEEMKGPGGMLAWKLSIRISGFVSALVVEVLLPVFEWSDEREAVVAGIFRIGRFVGFSAFTGPNGFSNETTALMMMRWVEPWRRLVYVVNLLIIVNEIGVAEKVKLEKWTPLVKGFD